METENSLKRYTELPYVLQALVTRKLTFQSPKSWDDKNDAYWMEQFRKKAGHGSVLAMCLSQTNPTYHHWRLFTHGASGAALYFKPTEFHSWLLKHPSLQGREVQYFLETQVSNDSVTLNDLPYTKRRAYEAEAEFRVILSSVRRNKKIATMDFDLSMVKQVVLNPWMPKETCNAVRHVIRRIEGCSEIPVRRATMVESDKWKTFALSVTSPSIESLDT